MPRIQSIVSVSLIVASLTLSARFFDAFANLVTATAFLGAVCGAGYTVYKASKIIDDIKKVKLPSMPKLPSINWPKLPQRENESDTAWLEKVEKGLKRARDAVEHVIKSETGRASGEAAVIREEAQDEAKMVAEHDRKLGITDALDNANAIRRQRTQQA